VLNGQSEQSRREMDQGQRATGEELGSKRAVFSVEEGYAALAAQGKFASADAEGLGVVFQELLFSAISIFDFRSAVSKGCKPRVGIALGSGKSQPLRALCFHLAHFSTFSVFSIFTPPPFQHFGAKLILYITAFAPN